MNNLRSLVKVFTEISDEKTMECFFNELFTEAERSDFASRWQLMVDLKSGMPQRAIAEKLNISLCKITRGSKILKDPKSISLKILENNL